MVLGELLPEAPNSGGQGYNEPLLLLYLKEDGLRVLAQYVH